MDREAHMRRAIALSHEHMQSGAGGPFGAVIVKDGAVIALDCVNCPRDFVQGKALVARRAVLDAGQLADPAVPLKSMTG